METLSEPLLVIGTGILTNGHGFYAVPSSSDPTRCYLVEQWPGKLTCPCKDAFFRHRQCKHILAVTAHKQKIQIEEANAASVRDEAEEDEMRWGMTDTGLEPLAAMRKAHPRISASPHLRISAHRSHLVRSSSEPHRVGTPLPSPEKVEQCAPPSP